MANRESLEENSPTVFINNELVDCAVKLSEYIKFTRKTELTVREFSEMGDKIRNHHNVFKEVSFNTYHLECTTLGIGSAI